MALTEGLSPADIKALGNNNDFGGNGIWWILILFIFAMNGWGGYGNGGAQNNYVLSSDFATIQRQLSDGFGGVEKGIDTIRNGLCDGFYTEAQLLNGVNTNILQTGNAIQSQLAQCCCDNREAIAGVNYNMAMNTNAIQKSVSDGFCQTNFNAQTNARDIIESQNSNTRAILDALNAQAIEAKDARIAEQNQQIFAYQLAASQQAQNNYLINQLRPAPVPAFQVANPYAYNGCGCGCNL